MATPCITGPEREVHIQNEAESCAKGVSCHSVLNWQPAEEVLPRHVQESNAPDEHGAHPEIQVYTRRTRDAIVSSAEPASQMVPNQETEFISRVSKQLPTPQQLQDDIGNSL
jgi:hypothetical protein